MPNEAEKPRNAVDNPVVSLDCVQTDDGVRISLHHRYLVGHTMLKHFYFNLPRDQALELLALLQRDAPPLDTPR